MQDETNGVNFLSLLCLFSPDGASSPDSNSLCNDYCQKSFPPFLEDSAPHCPGKKYKCAMLFSTRFRKRFRLKSRTTHRRPLASNVYFWDNSSCDTRFWTIINSMTEKSRMRCCLFSFSSRIYTERNIFPQVFFFIQTHKKGKKHMWQRNRAVIPRRERSSPLF